MAKYKVRDHFWLHGLGNEPIPPGTEVELTDEQAEAYAHQVEQVASKPAKGKAGAGAG